MGKQAAGARMGLQRGANVFGLRVHVQADHGFALAGFFLLLVPVVGGNHVRANGANNFRQLFLRPTDVVRDELGAFLLRVFRIDGGNLVK